MDCSNYNRIKKELYAEKKKKKKDNCLVIHSFCNALNEKLLL